jgi:rhodanese-related sulfurtransferase
MLQQLLQFIGHHWVLSSMLLLTLLLLFWEESKNKSGGSRLSLSDATNLINRQHAVLIDLREAPAFQSGHIVNALNFPQNDIMSRLEKLKKYQDKPLILVDSAGQQAALIGNRLRTQGFNKVYCLAGGLQSWTNAGLPLIK